MYENDYPNNKYHYETEDGGQKINETLPSQEKKSGGKLGFGKKIMVGICCGLCFGIFAGLGFQAVNTAGDMLRGIESQVKEASSMDESKAQENADTLDNSEADIVNEEATAAIGTQLVQTTVTDVTEVVKNVMPSLVSVNNKFVEKVTFFGQQYSNEAESAGSGIIVGQNEMELLLVSNYHVIASAEELTVQFVDGSQVQAQIKGYDADKDLAVIAVKIADISSDTMEQIAVAKMGDSNALTVGEPVIAIGNALGYGQSVTTGVVSALNRAIAATSTVTSGTDTEINTFIQTDAAINPGNSGGALVNVKGELIGINSNKIGGSTVEGMGYAIPISEAQPIIEKLMSKDRVDEANRGYLGITGVDVKAEYAETYGMPRGVYVSSVMEGTGAEAAGLLKGDIITEIDGEEILSMSKLKEELSYYAAGTTVELTIMQGNPSGYQAKTVSVTLGVAQNTQ